MNKKNLLVILIAVAGAALILYQVFADKTPFDQRKPAVRDIAPAISLADSSGRMVSLSSLKGTVVLVNFWASWCPPCKSEMPGFQKVFTEYHDKGFAVIGIALDDVSPGLLKELGITFPIVRANERVLRDYGGISDVPVSFLVGADGKIFRKVKKVYAEDDLRKDLLKALQTAGPEKAP